MADFSKDLVNGVPQTVDDAVWFQNNGNHTVHWTKGAAKKKAGRRTTAPKEKEIGLGGMQITFWCSDNSVSNEITGETA